MKAKDLAINDKTQVVQGKVRDFNNIILSDAIESWNRCRTDKQLKLIKMKDENKWRRHRFKSTFDNYYGFTDKKG
eukprot:CAMPEP_0116957598 /NCGR_PEP_ID=MMETSP0467-20121206/44079_1 /TAXON_ID=283647 /ORGANISM="Mesodinium pulex, Strain SPMC105" /LENGTH=74 /DNA_ID=CAMNT_0004644403 /DNA_START=1557 /DNA_END=1781 /DNA_ORIENTATION=+